jgi:hypothetical protein
MRALLYITAIFAFIFISIYTFLFTSIGNPLTAHYINEKLSQSLALPTKIDNFRLSTSKIAFALDIDGKNKLLVAGKYSLLSRDFDLFYDISFNDISSFSELAKRPLQGNFNTNGYIRGNLDELIIKGSSDIALSDTNYKASIKDTRLSNLQLVMKNADIAKLLYMIKEKEILKGKLHINGDISSFDPHNLQGKLDGYVSKGAFNTSLIKKDFKIDIPKSSFTSKFDVTLNKDITYDINFDSTLAKLDSKGKIKPRNQEIKSDFNLFISKLELLESLTKTKLKGDIKVQGSLSGDKNDALLNIKSDLANSDTNLDIKLLKFQPVSINGKIRKLQLSQILYMLNQPSYLKKGSLDMVLDIKSLEKENYKGDITTTLSNGVINSRTVEKEFKQKLPKNTSFFSKLQTKLDKTKALTTGEINSSIADIMIKDLVYDLKNSSLDTKGSLSIQNLSKLEPLTKQKLRGNLKIDIKSTIDKDTKARANSNLLGGNFSSDTLNEKTDISLKNIDVKSLLYMLYYPQVYNGKANGTINIDTKKELVKFNIDLKNGHFEKNELSYLLANALKLDLTNENFSYAVIKGTKKKNIINSDIKMQSQNLNISTKRSVIDTKKQLINSVFNFKYRHYDFDVTVKGDLNSPKVSSKIAQTILKEKAKSKLEEKLGDRLNDDVKGLLQNLLKF